MSGTDREGAADDVRDQRRRVTRNYPRDSHVSRDRRPDVTGSFKSAMVGDSGIDGAETAAQHGATSRDFGRGNLSQLREGAPEVAGGIQAGEIRASGDLRRKK